MKVGKRILLTCAFACVTVSLFGQEEGLSVVRVNKQRWFSAVPAGNYSGITHVGDNRYAIVDDKHQYDGFLIVKVETDPVGQILSVVPETYRTDSTTNRDAEGIAYIPQRNTLLISGEKNNDIIERTPDGTTTGFTVSVPNVFMKARGNNGLEALSYNTVTETLWTCNESTITTDGDTPTPTNQLPAVIRLHSFDKRMCGNGEYLYMTDTPTTRKQPASYVLGVSDLCALDDGSLLVLERECFITKNKLGSFVTCKLYHAFPEKQTKSNNHNKSALQQKPIHKELLYKWTTRMTLFHQDFANYEGMCLMPPLEDGSLVLLLVADSQNQYGGLLRDWFMTIVLR